MTRYDVTFIREDGGRRQSRHIIEANNIDEAMAKANNMREANYYNSVWVSPRKEGLAPYVCEIVVDCYFDGKKTKHSWPTYQRIEATSEAEAERLAKVKFIGKFYKGVDYREDKQLLDSPTLTGQSMKFVKITDSYQI